MGPIQFVNVIVVIPPLNPALPSQIAAPMPGGGPQLPIPKDPKNFSENSSIGRLIIQAVQKQDPQSPILQKALRILAALNPARLPPKEIPGQAAQKAIVIQRDEVQPKNEKSKSDELVNLQVFKVENEELGSKEQNLADQKQQMPSEKKQFAAAKKDGTEAAPEPEKSLESEKPAASQQPSKPSEAMGKEAKSNLPNQVNKTSEQTSIKANVPESQKPNLKESPDLKSYVKVSKELFTKKEPQALPSEKSQIDKKNAPEKSVPAQSIEKKAETSEKEIHPEKIIEKEKEKIKEKERLPIDHETKRIEPREEVAVKQAQHQQQVQQQMQRPVPDNMAISAWLGILPLSQQLDEQRLRREGKAAKLQSGSMMVSYQLSNMLFMLLSGAVGGCNTLVDFIKFIEAREKWFKVILGPTFAIPSREMIWRFVSTLKEGAFDSVVKSWLDEVCGRGQNVDEKNGKPILPAIALWQTPVGIIFGQSQRSDPTLGTASMKQLLQAFNFEETLILTKCSVENVDLPRYIERAKADFFVEIEGESSQAEEIEIYLERDSSSHKEKSQILESYIEGVDRIVVQTMTLENNSQLTLGLTVARIAQALKVHFESISKGMMSSREHFYISNLDEIGQDFLDLFRLQQPIYKNVDWLLNCQLPIRPFKMAMQQCNKNLALFKRYAKELLHSSGGELSIDEKMKRSAASTDALLEYLNSDYFH